LGWSLESISVVRRRWMGWVVRDVGHAEEVNEVDVKGGGRDTIDGICLSDVCERRIEG